MSQPDLLPRDVSPIRPSADRSEPRLWIQRLTIWRKRDEAVREISFRRGLNIIWSPDATAGSRAIGHGGGKTMLCRLLRYCLGEETFAPEGHRLRVWETFPDGFLSAEVRLDGEDWLIYRSLGSRRRDFALRGGALDDVFAEDARPTGLGPFTTALAAIVAPAAPLMPAKIGGASAWPAALAWLARDQECRFDKLLHWRDPSSDSRSPVAATSEGERLEIVRGLINALTTAEQDVRRKEDELSQTLTKFRTDLGYKDWELRSLASRLVQPLQLLQPPAVTVIDAEVLTKAAKEKLALVAGVSSGGETLDISAARDRRNEAYERLKTAERNLAVTEVEKTELAKLLPLQESELGPLSVQIRRGEIPSCPICHVAVDRVLAEGCGITLEVCDLVSLNAEYGRKTKAVEESKARVRSLEGRIQTLKSDVALARQQFDPLEKAVAAHYAALSERSRKVRAAERVSDDAERFSDAVSARLGLIAKIETAESEIGRIKDQLVSYRSQAGEVIMQLSQRFDETIRAIVPGDVSGSVKLDGNGLHPKLGGDRTSAAIESLKIAAFDLAVLIRSIEGGTNLPAFLIHDSPREADLGESIYELLFKYVLDLEAVGDTPLFQYIVTTTTAPPTGLRVEPWLRLELHGAPPDQRLLRVDL